MSFLHWAPHVWVALGADLPCFAPDNTHHERVECLLSRLSFTLITNVSSLPLSAGEEADSFELSAEAGPCSGLSHYPNISIADYGSVSGADAMQTSGDDLVGLCEYSFDQAVRGEGGRNPSILSIGRVECPEELVFMTQMQRNDDPAGFTPESPMKAEHACQADIPNMPLDWCLTRMMDCRKPSGAWRSSVKPELMVPGRKLVQTCTSDGYTRIDNQCGCFDCDC